MPAIRQDQTLLRLIRDVNEIRSALRRVTVNLPLFDISNENSPTALSADQNNYVPGNYDILRMDATTDVSITGFRGGVKGRYLEIYNVSSYKISLEHQNASSDAVNRIISPNSQTVVLFPSMRTRLYYDSTLERWIIPDLPQYASANGLTAIVTNSGATQSIPDGSQTKLTFSTVVTDEWGLWDSVNQYFEIPTGFGGAYIGVVFINWYAVVGSTTRTLFWSDDIASVFHSLDSRASISATTLGITLAMAKSFAAGDKIAPWVFQASGGALNAEVYTMTLTKIR